LGCLNHALLTAQVVRGTGLPLAGWVANRIDSKMAAFDENVLALEQRLNCPLVGVLPFEQNADAKTLSTLLNIAVLEQD
jgi:dethiobiotin synthetase